MKDADILDLLATREQTPGTQEPLPDYARQIVTGVADHYKRINGLLNRHASRRISRMHIIDRNILRIGVWEIIYNDEVPGKVAIDEAMQLAKKYSDENVPGFIHAVLSAIGDDPDAVPEGDDESQRSMGPAWKKHQDDLPEQKKASASPALVGSSMMTTPVRCVCPQLSGRARTLCVRRHHRRVR